MSRRKKGRIYWRERGGEEPRAYGDFRDFADVGGGREALKPPGAKRATTDPEIAEKLAADRVEELQERRRRKVIHGIERTAGLKEFAAYHLREKAKTGNVSEQWLEAAERHLTRATEFLGTERELNSIGSRDVQQLTAHLLELPNGRGGTLSEPSVRKHLNSLSNLYRRAQSEGYVPSDFNPVASLMDKPAAATSAEADWLEVDQAAVFLEASRHYDPEERRAPIEFSEELVATFLLTGGRKAEILGLEVGDVSFDRRTVTFEPNEHRELKTDPSHRSVPLWPQLEEILRPYVFGDRGPKSGLLFPSPRTGKMLTDTRKMLDEIAGLIGWSKKRVRTKVFRHTYCAARLQTTDRGQPVSQYTVAQELGHGGSQLVERVYGHLGEIRHREEVVEYRPENHLDSVGEKVRALRAHGRVYQGAEEQETQAEEEPQKVT